MSIDNTTDVNAKEYDNKINNTIPYLGEFYVQTLSLVGQMDFPEINWLDLGCGTGALERRAMEVFPHAHFVMVDPAEKMLEQAKEKNPALPAEYILTCSEQIHFENEFHVVTAIQSHHYLKETARKTATRNAYRALRQGGIYIAFENVIPDDGETKEFELQRWGKYQLSRGKTQEQVNAHIARCGVNYFPLTVRQHVELFRETGFKRVHVFWYSYMQMGIYGIK